MRNLSFCLILFLAASGLFAQSPHGKSIGNRDCSSCHISSTWKIDKDKMQFQHDETDFKLSGQHTTLDCASCHKTLVFSEAQTNCFSCHKDVHQNTVGLNCERCHSTNTWIVKNINQIHQLGRFPLVGVHQSVDCQRCHQGYNNLNFQPINSTCFSCHSNNYYGTTAPNHVAAGYSTDCESCHSVSSAVWAAQNTKHDFFPLQGGHKIDNCFACHKQNTFAGLSQDCVSCHLNNYNNTTNPNHAAVKMSTDCKSCHTINSFLQAAFNHTTTGFALTGKHITISCNDCHKGTAVTTTTCISCHQANYNSAPNHSAQSYPTDCTMCHSTTNWTQSTFNHAATAFPLTGTHITITCSSCHTNGFGAIPITCVSCHQANYNSTTNPNHVSLAIPTDCSTCHTITAGWKPATFAIHNNYYVLAGAHTSLTCANCHNGNYSTNIPNTCYGCHKTNYDNTTNPIHVSAGFGTDCQTCHSQTAWQPATFNHDQQFFPIYSGSHNNRWTTCADCHTVPTNYLVFSCMTGACHPQASTNNQHSGVQGYSYVASQCLACHPTGSSGGFNHASSIFPLTGAHITVSCIQCHQNGYPNTPTACVSCHQTDFNNTKNPNHISISISTDCQTCHTTTAGWVNALFPNHNTYFQLTGAHITTATCATCHNGNFTNSTPATCVGCHQSSFNGAVNPNHTAAGIPAACETCHNSTAWIPSTFVHTNTGFALTGLHATIQCSSCHVGKVTGLSPLCVPCHQSVYNTALNHVSQNYPTTCELCHSTTNWTQSTFNHQTTQFPLTGAHTTVTCNNCHTNGFGAIPITCVSCHQANYNSASNPNHTALSLVTTCETCHTTNSGWAPATFPIHSTYYVLAGAHTSIVCASCHTNDTYNGSTPKTCIGCHQTDYNATTNPNHTAAQFPTDCASCHSQTVWTGATFNHDAQYFPIYSGHHSGRWTLCSQCHQDPVNFVTFTCMSSGCHAKSSVDSHHNGVNGYVYTAAACYNCHPKGSAGKLILPHKRILD